MVLSEALGIWTVGSSGHSLRKGAAQHAHDSRILDDGAREIDLGGINGVFYDERVSFVQAQSPVPGRVGGPAVSTASTTVP